eukprot:PhM_4_TR2625/c0_g2_i1/m.696
MQRLSAATQSTLFATSRRAYTEYHHRKYPLLGSIAYGLPAFWIALFMFYLRIGHVNTFTGYTDYKKDVMKGFYRWNGYKWADEIELVETSFKNLPTGAK